MPNNGTSLRNMIFGLMLSSGLALTGLMGLLITRLRHPLIMHFLRPWQATDPLETSSLEDMPLTAWPLMKNQFEIDLAATALTILGLFLIIYYRRRISPILAKLEDMSLDRW